MNELIRLARKTADSLVELDEFYGECDHKDTSCTFVIEGWGSGEEFTADDLRAMADELERLRDMRGTGPVYVPVTEYRTNPLAYRPPGF